MSETAVPTQVVACRGSQQQERPVVQDEARRPAWPGGTLGPGWTPGRPCTSWASVSSPVASGSQHLTFPPQTALTTEKDPPESLLQPQEEAEAISVSL